jgi:hypothetical protein
VKIIAESLSQHDEKYVVPPPLSEIRGRRRDRTKGLTALTPEMESDGNGLTTCHCSIHHHQPINVPTAGAQAFVMDYPQGERAITHHAGPVRIGGC